MKYKNTKTGAIINSSCKISGGNWIPYEKTIKETYHNHEGEEISGGEEVPSKEPEATKEEPKQEATIEGVTKKQIIQELDAMGIKYNPRDKKEELYSLMLGK